MNFSTNEFSSLEEVYNCNTSPLLNEDHLEMRPLEHMFEEESSRIMNRVAEPNQDSTNDQTIDDEPTSI